MFIEILYIVCCSHGLKNMDEGKQSRMKVVERRGKSPGMMGVRGGNAVIPESGL